MATTIQITKSLQQELNSRKLFSKETYEEIIWALIEDTKELTEETKKDIKEARTQMAKGEYYTLSQAKKRLKH